MTALQIRLMPELLDEGPACEKAAFGLLEIEADDRMLTVCTSVDSNGRHYHDGPYVSGYHLAEWLAWNWWRLRWEPRPADQFTPSLNWTFAHYMTCIGQGYVWPNITFSSDGFECNLTSERSTETNTSLIYHGAKPVIVSATNFEDAVDQFVGLILQLVSDAGIANTNLQTIWDDLTAERNDREIARFRRLEALLGFDPDESEAQKIENLLHDAPALGENALDEIATGAMEDIKSARQIAEETELFGFDINTNDAIRLSGPIPIQWGHSPAWQIGVAAANAVRQQAGLADTPIADSRLADLAGISTTVIESEKCTNSLSWVFHTPQDHAQVALRPRWKNGRRFDVARLLGDSLFAGYMGTSGEPLSPATRSYSYRQKAQRAFAAELLSPLKAVRDMLGNDYSQENQEQVAEYFAVSPMTISTLLVNNERTGRWGSWE